jgi:hypothetical protein
MSIFALELQRIIRNSTLQKLPVRRNRTGFSVFGTEGGGIVENNAALSI